MSKSLECAVCHKPIKPSTNGLPRTYCGAACKVRARDMRRLGKPADWRSEKKSGADSVVECDASELCDPCSHLRNGKCKLGRVRAKQWDWDGKSCEFWDEPAAQRLLVAA